MERSKKRLAAILMLILTVGGLWLYWNWEFPLDSVLPEENWEQVQILYGDVESKELIRDDLEVELDEVLAAIRKTRVSRAERNRVMGGKYFIVYLYSREAGYPTLINVSNDGKLSVAEALDTDRYRYFEDGGVLFEALAAGMKAQDNARRE